MTTRPSRRCPSQRCDGRARAVIIHQPLIACPHHTAANRDLASPPSTRLPTGVNRLLVPGQCQAALVAPSSARNLSPELACEAGLSLRLPARMHRAGPGRTGRPIPLGWPWATWPGAACQPRAHQARSQTPNTHLPSSEAALSSHLCRSALQPSSSPQRRKILSNAAAVR